MLKIVGRTLEVRKVALNASLKISRYQNMVFVGIEDFDELQKVLSEIGESLKRKYFATNLYSEPVFYMGLPCIGEIRL